MVLEKTLESPLNCKDKAILACYSRYLLTSYFCILIPYDEKDILFGVNSSRSCRFRRTSQISFFSIRGQGIDLDYCDVACLALETNQDHSVIFENCTQVLHFELFC